ncbi:ATP-dependent endonuclease [Saccharicrinis sp. FJH54]|uniref:ATP-dependent nuclease n=1 Tax=Saccharicrinis sp. FJH54 TaxID=3344665 RepID=UPI0035D49F47
MIEIDIQPIQIPVIWGEKTFKKTQWSEINLIVGPNGTGKSLLAENLKNQLNKKGYKARILNAERLAGLEKNDYSYFTSSNFRRGFDISHFGQFKSNGDNYGLSTSAFVLLKERLDIRIKVEALLSDIFKKTIRLIEEGGFMKPKIQDLNGTAEYSLKEQECHGLKELITLFTFLYSDQYECLIFDEPELHLHPQFQSFFLSEIRKMSGNPKTDPSKKIFFIITHSPYFLDFQTINDLQNLLVCHFQKPPTYIDELNADDEWRLKKFLPRFNTHHKQFFFSPNPVFVEGHTDQQIITLMFEKLNKNIGASGSSVIDVGGKDELEVFFRICKKLNLKARFIADLDTLFKGKLRQTVSADERAQKFIQQNGIGSNVSSEIGDVESKLKIIADDLISKTTADSDISELIIHLKALAVIPDEIHHYRYSLLLGIKRFKDKIENVISAKLKPDLNLILGRVNKLIEAFETCNVYILPDGELEHYFIKSPIQYLNIVSKDKLFEEERDYILLCNDKNELTTNYSNIIEILNKSVPVVNIDLYTHLKYVILEWIQIVQRGIAKGEIISLDNLKSNAKVDYKIYNQIFTAEELTINPDKKFICKIKFKNSLIETDKEIQFDEKTIAHEFKLD